MTRAQELIKKYIYTNVCQADVLLFPIGIDKIKLIDNNGPDEVTLSADVVASMTKAQLAELAKAKDIDISDCKNKADIVERINGALGLVSMVQLGLET